MASCPADLKPFEIAYKERRRLLDVDMYNMGLYIYNATLAAVDNALKGRESKVEYLKKPLSEIAKEKKLLNGEDPNMDDDEKIYQQKRVMSILKDMQKRFEAHKKREEGG